MSIWIDKKTTKNEGHILTYEEYMRKRCVPQTFFKNALKKMSIYNIITMLMYEVRRDINGKEF